MAGADRRHAAPTWSGLDWTVNLGAARASVGDRVALQGNLDPNVLFAPPEAVRAEAHAALDSFGPPQRADGSWDGHVFNLGHGISQHTPPEHVAALVDAVHAHSRSAARAARPERRRSACATRRSAQAPSRICR